MRWNSLLKFGGFKRTKSGKWLDTTTNREVKLDTAYERSAKKLGYTSHKKAKEAFRSKAYQRIVASGYYTRKPNGVLLKQKVKVDSFAKQAGIKENDPELQRLFAQAWQETSITVIGYDNKGGPITKKSKARDNKALAQLLKYVGRLNKYTSSYDGVL